jgi:hypothetical protein
MLFRRARPSARVAFDHAAMTFLMNAAHRTRATAADRPGVSARRRARQ